MKAKVGEIIDMLDMQSDEMYCFLDTKTGEPFYLDEDLHRAIEDEEDLDSFADWQIEEIQKAKEVFDSGNYLTLPDRFEVHEYRIMDNFCNSIENKFFSNKLQDAIHGKGAFKKFKDAVSRYDLWNDWNKFKANALKEFAIEWCKENDLEII